MIRRSMVLVLTLVSLVLEVPAQTTKKYLFVDDRWIARSYQVIRTVVAPAKEATNPVLIADKPWEGKDVYVYGTVIVESGKFRVWYEIYNSSEPSDSPFQTCVGYAESRDGLHWEKPLMDAVKYKGQQTNIVLLSHGTSALCSPAVVRDDNEKDPAKKYKMLYWDSMSKEGLKTAGENFPLGTTVPGWRAIPGEGFFVAYSPDGLKWTNSSKQPVFTCPCDASSLNKSPDGLYHAFYKISVAPDRHFRILGHSSSRDFIQWTEPKVILEPDWKDAYGTEFYGMSYIPYFGNDLGLLWMYHNAPNDKHVDLQLAQQAADGSWRRAADRQTWLAAGGLGVWDGGGTYPASDILISPPGFPDEIWLYYGGTSVFHDDSRFRETSIGLARFRIDGFAAMRSQQFQGWFETTTVTPEGGTLFVNADCLHGTMLVEILDPSSRNVIGRSTVLKGQNKTRIPIAWEANGGQFSKGKAMVLRYSMQRSDLYSFWFE